MNGVYWERACQFFERSGLVDARASYFVHDKNAGRVDIGVGTRRTVAVDARNSVSVSDVHTGRQVVRRRGSAMRQVEQLLVRDAPCFFLVSPDLARSFADESLPLALFVQPALELHFSPEHPEGVLGHAADAVAERRGKAMLEALAEVSPRPASPVPDAPEAFSRLVSGWRSAESDEQFLRRLTAAVGALQEHADGKMALTRAYERVLPPGLDPFQLYQLHARANGEYACSHFSRIEDAVVCLGASPENVFETRDGQLTVDVVAATCRSTPDAQGLTQELSANPKQLKEHWSSLASRQRRFRDHCTDGSLRVVQDTRVKRLRNVSHLHSVFTGELRPGVSPLDLMDGLFPLLGARPPELLPLADAEPAPHRYFAGLVGRLNDQSAAAFLNIRNLLLLDETMHAKVGVGVIKESDPHSELVETQDKLSGVLEAVWSWVESGPEPEGVA
ncbi:chorismate-binding protein [Nocardioides campestrisoli]|uniref:chorismate-binding protein n=1 Tax=Nocardioides campestrisoli TaxID=2736757 RepID=UPI00163D9632|nr:chorismate-binding protein [Nocardioides campestrisoli]